MPSPESSYKISVMQLHVAVLLAGATGLFPKLISMPPAVVTCGRMIVSACAMLLALLFLKSTVCLRGGKDLMKLAVSGAILGLSFIAFFVAIDVSTVAIGLLAFSTYPLFVTFLEPLFFRERLHPRDVLTAVLVVIGLILVVPNWDLNNHFTQGVIWGVLAAVTSAAVSLLSRSYVRDYPPLTVAFYQQGFAALSTLPFALGWNGTLAQSDILFIVVTGVLFTAFPQALAMASLRHLRAQTVSVAFGLEPLYGIVMAWLFLHEKLGTRTVCGGALILGAVLWSSLKHQPVTSAEAHL